MVLLSDVLEWTVAVDISDDLQLLAGHGCDIAQGYLFTRPLPADALAELRHESGRSAAIAWREAVERPAGA